MQCWGDDDGTDPGNPGPAAGAVRPGRHRRRVRRPQRLAVPGRQLRPRADHLAEDFAELRPGRRPPRARTGYLWRPFRAVDGTVVNAHYDPDFNPAVVGGNYWLNPYFNAITTNEIAGGRTGPNGTGAELFEVDTGLESSGLGLRPAGAAGGRRRRRRSRSAGSWSCRGAMPATENAGHALRRTRRRAHLAAVAVGRGRTASPIPLEFNPIDSAVRPRRRAAPHRRQRAARAGDRPAGSRSCAPTPGLPPVHLRHRRRRRRPPAAPQRRGRCARAWSPWPGPSTRDRSTAANPVVYAPISLSATVIGFNIERIPKLGRPLPRRSGSGASAWPSSTSRRAWWPSCSPSPTGCRPPSRRRRRYDWAADNPPHLGRDPDFLRFNPEFELLENGGKNFGGLVMPAAELRRRPPGVGVGARRPRGQGVARRRAGRVGHEGQPRLRHRRPAPTAPGCAFGDPVPDSFPKSDPYCYQAPAQGAGRHVVPAAAVRHRLAALHAEPPRRRPPHPGAPTTAPGRSRTRSPASSDQRLPARRPADARVRADPVAHRLGLGEPVRRPDGPPEPGRRRRRPTGRSSRPTPAGSPPASRRWRPATSSTVLEPDPTATGAGRLPADRAHLRRHRAARARRRGARRLRRLRRVRRRAPARSRGTSRASCRPGYAPLPAALGPRPATAARTIRELQPDRRDRRTDTPGVRSHRASRRRRATGDAAAVGPGGRRLDRADGPTGGDPSDDADCAGRGPVTPILALARNRFVLPALALIALCRRSAPSRSPSDHGGAAPAAPPAPTGAP